MNEKELAEIEARVDPFYAGEMNGKWVEETDENGDEWIRIPGGHDVKFWNIEGSSGCCYAVTHFIAHARQDVPALCAEVRRLSGENERLLATIQDTCTWSEDDDTDDVIWDTECGETVVFEDGTPKENGYRHCHYCGKNIIFSLKGGAQ